MWAAGDGGEREGVFRRKKQSRGGGGGVPVDRIRPGGRIRFKQYVSVGLSCH